MLQLLSPADSLLPSPSRPGTHGGHAAHFGVLHCLGWTTTLRGNINERIGLVFAYPPTSSGRPISLKERIKISLPTSTSSSKDYRQSIPFLGARFRLAQCLTQMFGNLLIVEYLHKGLRSDSVFFFDEDKVDSPFLGGFTEARPEMIDGQVSSNLDDADEEFDHYRPYSPAMVGKSPNTAQKQPWNAYAELYGLGVILLEIGLWKTIGHVRGRGSLRDLHERLIPEAAKSLPYRTGEIYFNVVKECLDGGEKWRRQEGLGARDFWFEFSEKILRPLAQCCA